MPEPRRFTTPDPSLTKGGETTIDATAREFLDAQEPQFPATVAEMRDATKYAFDSVIKTLGTTASLEEWVAATNDLEVTFFDSNDGALAEQIRLALGKDTLDAAEWAAAEELVRQTADIAARIYPIVHRLQALGFAATREEVVRKLEVGDLTATTKVHNVSIVPRRRTLIGLLRDLDAKVGANVWSLEFPPEIPAKIIVADPFDDGAEDTARLWRQRIVAKNAVEPGVAHSIYTISGDITAKVAFELGTVGDRTKDAKLKEATSTIVAWLDRKSIYYQDPDKRDFALYHLGMEQPQDLMKIFRSLDAIKHADPELFLELVGINPDGGGKSPYFGSFLHKALFNTQKAVDRADKLGEMAIRTMLKQLLTLDATVSTYSGVVSKEAMDAMGAQIKDRVAAEPTDADKAMALIMMAVPYSQVVVDAEIRRQLEELRGINLEKIKEAFDYRIADIEHPLKLLEYLKWMPRTMFDDDDVCREIRKAFQITDERSGTPEALYDWLHDHLDHENYGIVATLYKRIPLLDESRTDLGFARRIIVAIRDVDSRQGVVVYAMVTNPVESLNVARDTVEERLGSELRYYLNTTDDIETISRQLPFAQRRLLRHVAFDGKAKRHALIGTMRRDAATAEPTLLAQVLVSEKSLDQGRFDAGLIHEAPNPDLVLLSVLANPNGAAVAFEHFDKFCERIEPERMYQILHDQIVSPSDPPYYHPALKKFYKEFTDHKPELHTTAYVDHLRAAILKLHDADSAPVNKDIDLHLKLNRVLVDKRTPWTVEVKRPRVNNAGIVAMVGPALRGKMRFDLWQTMEASKSLVLYEPRLHHLPIPTPDEIKWRQDEWNFVHNELLNGNEQAFLSNTTEHGIVLELRNPNKPGNPGAKLHLNLKSRPT